MNEEEEPQKSNGGPLSPRLPAKMCTCRAELARPAKSTLMGLETEPKGETVWESQMSKLQSTRVGRPSGALAFSGDPRRVLRHIRFN